MVITRFPDPRDTTPEGIVALGGDLEPASLKLAYSQGIFPWPIEGLPLPWFCPPERAILEWKELHIPRSLERLRKKNRYRYTLDLAFEKVISCCAHIPRPDQGGTWITQDIKNAYVELHRLGHAHSIEIWKDQALVGGLYGVDAEGVFAGESMFHLEANTSKLAILFLMEYLNSRGSDWMDIQVMTPHMQAMGARLISRDDFLKRLEFTRRKKLKLFENR